MAGAGGMLGEAFYNVFKNNNELFCTDKDTNSIWLNYLDFRNYDEYKKQVEKFNPDWIFHLGAYTDLEFCEKNEQDTYTTNTESVKFATRISNDLNINLLYISTAGIFDGKKDFYDENDKPNPLGHYGNSKYLGEKYVIENANKYLICRAGWMMGGGEKKDKKFVNKIINQIKNGSKIINVVNDKLGTPTYTYDFANNVNLLIDNNQFGLFNMVCEGLTGRLEVAKEIVNLLNMNNLININEVSTDFFAQTYFAERPLNERLINQKLKNINLNIMRDWKIALKEYIEKEYKNLILK